MNTDHIKTFLEVAATGNFLRAAERLNVTQSTVSARIKALEDQLRQPLFTRGRSGVELTAAGQQFLRHALTVVRAWEQARQELALPKGLSAVFGLGAQFSLWQRLAVAWASWMRARAPAVALRLEADYSDSLMQQLANGLLDLCVMYVPRHMPGLRIDKLFEEKLVLVHSAPPEAGRDWRDDYVFVHWGADFCEAHSKAFPELGPTAVSVGLGLVGLQFILENGGAGYFPLPMVQPLIGAAKLFRVADSPVFSRPAYLVYSEKPADEALLELAIEGLRRVAAADAEDGPAG